jgi:hypothetical protein
MNHDLMTVAELIAALQEVPQDAAIMTLEGPVTSIEVARGHGTVTIS